MYFFLSYARGDDDRFVQKFYRDLCAEVRVLTGDREKEVGFLDRHNIPLGAPWPRELVEALAKCQVFLALCSPSYFRSEPCGIEWSVFAERLNRYDNARGLRAPALIPLAWTRTRMHPVAAERQHDFEGFGEPYRREGLRQMIRLTSKRNAYLRFVTALAERIVSTAQAHELPPYTADTPFHTTPSAFYVEPAESTGEDGAKRTKGQYVHFVVAAASDTQMRAVRSDVRYYGATHEHWAPYLPDLDRPLSAFAAEIANHKRLESEVADIESLPRRLREATQTNDIVVILVDPWASQLSSYWTVLSNYDRLNEPISAVLIPWNQHDDETRQREADLEADVQRMLTNNDCRRDPMFRPKIRTYDSFHEELQGVLEVARNRLLRRGTVRRLPPEKPDSGRPFLEGP